MLGYTRTVSRGSRGARADPRVRPALYAGFTYAYATLCFTSAFFVTSIGVSCVGIFVGRGTRTTAAAPLPYPGPGDGQDLSLVPRGQHRRTSPARGAYSTWLAIPEPGLYTGIGVVGAIGRGETSACIYPYVDQLLAYRASDPAWKAAGLVVEVKGISVGRSATFSAAHGRDGDCVEVSLDSPYRYNPLHDDLDAVCAGLRRVSEGCTRCVSPGCRGGSLASCSSAGGTAASRSCRRRWRCRRRSLGPHRRSRRRRDSHRRRSAIGSADRDRRRRTATTPSLHMEQPWNAARPRVERRRVARRLSQG